MSSLSIVPPLEVIHVAPLKRTPIALFKNDVEDRRGMIIDVELNPHGNYLAVVVVDVGCDQICTLGFIEHELCWVPVRKDPTGIWCHGMKPEIFDLRHAVD